MQPTGVGTNDCCSDCCPALRRWTGARRRIERPWFYRDRVVVLAFHDIAPEPQTAWCITPEQFETTLSRLQSIGFHYISPDELRAPFEHGTEVLDDAVLVTIDDGLEDVYTYAWPILQRLHVPALVQHHWCEGGHDALLP